MVHHTLLRLSATLLFIGLVMLTFVTIVLHPGGAPTQEATFVLYAASQDWVAVHLAQFIAIVLNTAGLLALFFALGDLSGPPRWVGFFGAILAGTAMGLYGVEQAIDGVALKQAVDLWISAPAALQQIRLANAETVRWLETGAGTYWNTTQGLALLLFAIMIVWSVRLPRPIGYLVGVAGVADIVVGWMIGTEGLSSFVGGIAQLVCYTVLLAATIWLLIIAWHRKEVVQGAPA